MWEQYDHIILGNTVQRPGGDAAVVRIDDGPKALALTTDVTPRYCEADPFEGGKQAVAEAWRNLVAVGARPLAITDNLNFGNPERPEIMGQLVGCIRGIAEACKALDFPVVVRQCVALQRDQRPRDPADPDHRRRRPHRRFRQVGLACVQAPPAKSSCWSVRRGAGSASRSTCATSAGGRRARRRRSTSRPNRATANLVRGLISDGVATAVHDISDGGLLVALAEMAMASGIGARLEAAPADVPAHAFWFGEDQARYVLTVDPRTRRVTLRASAAVRRCCRAPTRRPTGGNALTLPGERPIVVANLRERFEGWLPRYMAASRA